MEINALDFDKVEIILQAVRLYLDRYFFFYDCTKEELGNNCVYFVLASKSDINIDDVELLRMELDRIGHVYEVKFIYNADDEMLNNMRENFVELK